MNILQQLIQIITLQRRPQDIAFDQNSAVFYFVLTAGITFITSAQAGVFSQPLLISLIQTSSQALILFLFLKASGFATRFVQTATALFGTTAILSLIVWLLAQLPGVSFLVIFLTVWSFYLTILILRDALDASVLKSALFAIALGALSVFITMTLVPSYMVEAKEMFKVEAPSS